MFDEVDPGWPVQGVLQVPRRGGDLGVVVLGGSGGEVDVERGALFAARGATVLNLRWFGGEGQPKGICEVPLETFTAATDRLVAAGCRRIAYVGTSKGAEAALITAASDRRISAVVAMSPSSVAWANIGPGLDGQAWPQRASWTRNGAPIAFTPYAEDLLFRIPRTPPISYLALFQGSFERQGEKAAAAAIPIERSAAEVVLVAGGADAMWPSVIFAEALAARLAAAGRAARVVRRRQAGHRILLPGETPRPPGRNAHGGSEAADAALGAAAWPHILKALDLPA